MHLCQAVTNICKVSSLTRCFTAHKWFHLQSVLCFFLFAGPRILSLIRRVTRRGRRNMSEHVKQSEHFLRSTSREIYEHLPGEITCRWWVSILFIEAADAKTCEANHLKMKMSEDTQKKRKRFDGSDRLPLLTSCHLEANRETEGGLCTSGCRKKATWETESRKFNLIVIWCTHCTVCELN